MTPRTEDTEERETRGARRGRGAKGGRGARAREKRDGRADRADARSTVLDIIREIPDYLRLLAGLITDRGVSGIDKLLVAGAIAYVLAPIDMIPDVIPFLGQVDDVFLLTTALERLITNAGAPVLLRHWRGDPSKLSITTFRQVIAAAALFLPGRMRGRLRRMVRGR
ncbi:MAG TPA: DUF1232 domain-containing protein [Gemmatimonadaceae bacterium]